MAWAQSSDKQRFGRDAAAFVGAVLRATGGPSSVGSELLAWTRLPYISSASVSWTFQWLEQALFVVRVAGQTPDVAPPESECSSPSVDPACETGPGPVRAPSHPPATENSDGPLTQF